MTTSVSISVYLLLISNLLLICAVGLAIVRFLRRVDEFESFWESPSGTALSEETADDEHLALSQRLEKRVDELHQVVRVMAAKNSVKQQTPPRPAPVAPVTKVVPLENALRMAKNGASIEDLTRNCGLNIGEARLMQKLHGKARLAEGA
jgi:hypothetical protein